MFLPNILSKFSNINANIFYEAEITAVVLYNNISAKS